MFICQHLRVHVWSGMAQGSSPLVLRGNLDQGSYLFFAPDREMIVKNNDVMDARAKVQLKDAIANQNVVRIEYSECPYCPEDLSDAAETETGCLERLLVRSCASSVL